MSVLNKLEPSRVFYYFEQLCAIPHGSGNTDAISDYCVSLAKEKGFECIRDNYNNVIIKKPATKGYEGHPSVIIQGHLDMVCEKKSDCNIDFLKDGLDIDCDGEYIFAHGTTLGGDDGIAVAFALAILEDDSLLHPALEIVFTTDEETGMDGAHGLDTSGLSSKLLINVDSENEGVLTVSCAGGARADIELPLTSASQKMLCKKVTVSGLAGGHSGVEIDKGRLNASITLAKFLNTLKSDFYIADISGGLKDNAIPREAECVIGTNEDLIAAAEKFVSSNTPNTDSGLKITVSDAGKQGVFDKQSSKAAVEFLITVKNGIRKMSSDIEGLVQTSLNLGILRVENGRLVASFAVRSSVNSEKAELLENLKETAKEFGGSFSERNHYPAWEYKKDSYLRDTMVKVYKELYSKPPVIEAIHAGLECGLFCDKIEGLDAVSIGPDMLDIHTPHERLSVESSKRTYEYLCAVLKKL